VVIHIRRQLCDILVKLLNSLEREHRSDVAAKEEIGCICLCIFAATNHLPEPGPHHSAGHSDEQRVLCVSFNHRVTVYAADGYDCIGPWMRVAMDSMRCRRRIEQTTHFCTMFWTKISTTSWQSN